MILTSLDGVTADDFAEQHRLGAQARGPVPRRGVRAGARRAPRRRDGRRRSSPPTRLGMPLVHDDDARRVGARPGARSAARRSPPPPRPTPSCSPATANPFRLARCTAERCCWSPGPVIEAVAPACPGGRHSTTSSSRSGLTVVTVALDVEPRAHLQVDRRRRAHASEPDRHHARHRRPVRVRQHPDGRVDRRDRHHRAPRRGCVDRAQPAARHGDPRRPARAHRPHVP